MNFSTDLIARTILGEARNQPIEGKLGVAYSVVNRLKSGRYGDTVDQVLFAPYQYEPWNTRRAELESIPTDSPAYKEAYALAEAAEQGTVPDPTGGATHFLNPEVVQQRSGKQPSWYPGEGEGWQRIGDHVFGQADGGGSGQRRAPPASTRSPDSKVPVRGYEGGTPVTTTPDMPTEAASNDIAGILGDPNSPMARGLAMMTAEADSEAPQGLLSSPIYRPQAQSRGMLRSLLG